MEVVYRIAEPRPISGQDLIVGHYPLEIGAVRAVVVSTQLAIRSILLTQDINKVL